MKKRKEKKKTKVCFIKVWIFSGTTIFAFFFHIFFFDIFPPFFRFLQTRPLYFLETIVTRHIPFEIMAQSSSLHVYNTGFTNDRDEKVQSTTNETNLLTKQPDNVQGWLLNVHTYRDPEHIPHGENAILVDGDNNV